MFEWQLMNNELWTRAVTLRASCILIIEWTVNYLIICISLLKSEKPSARRGGWPWQGEAGMGATGAALGICNWWTGERAVSFIRWGTCKPGPLHVMSTVQEWHQHPGKPCPQEMDAWMLFRSVGCGELQRPVGSWLLYAHCSGVVALWICNCFPFGFRFKLFC